MTLSVTRAMTKRIIQLSSLLGILILMTGCGQKGPLHMPPERETTQPEHVVEPDSEQSEGQRANEEVSEGTHDPV